MCISIIMRPFIRSGDKKVITFYGHKYNGNLKAFAEYCMDKDEFKIYFVTLDPEYFYELKKDDDRPEVLFLQNFRDVLKVCKTDVFISDRRAHVLLYYLYLTRIPFVDVWHGLQIFKKFSPKDMAMLKSYSEIWVPSTAFAKIYKNDYLLDPKKIKVTGYARVDRLVKGDYNLDELKNKYGISKKYKRIILLAPTWQQDDPTREIIPFNENPTNFLKQLNKVASKNSALLIFRAHLNTNSANRSKLHTMKNIRVMSHNEYPQAEEFLAFTDVFIGDWSSIAFDYLPLHRPAIFLDVPMPFRHGLTFDESYRYGEVVGSLGELTESLDYYLNNPNDFEKRYSKSIKKTEIAGYGDTLDGRSSERYYKRLKSIVR